MTLEERILNVIKETFELDTADSSISNQTCENWDSIGQLNLSVDLEMEFGTSLEPEEIGRLKSFEDILSILKSKGIE